MKSPHEILFEYWGFKDFKSSQEDIITSVLNGNDTVALLPTGGGKSICFQVPALILEGICIVISPLVALMTNQVNSLKEKGIKAMALSGGISDTELGTLLDNAKFGNYKFLYMSPERLQQERVQNSIKEMNVNLFAIDEAHCISQWGNDFRPAYKNVQVLKALHPLIPTIALTATATPEVLTHTISELNLELPKVFQNSFIRKNLAYKVAKVDDKLYRIEQLLKTNTKSSIIYVRNRKSCSEIHHRLQTLGLSSNYFHGGISATDKKLRLQEWLDGKSKIMIATSAFGMGIDNPDVNYVIHFHLPESLESYFQEAGRAGRDGNYATALLLYNDYDSVLVKKQFVDSMPEVKDLRVIYRKLNNYFQIPYGEGEFTEHSFSFTEFCNTYSFNSLLCYNALNTLDRLGIIQLSKEFGRKSVAQFLVSSEKLLRYFETDVLTSVVGKTILRLYGGIFETPTKINFDLISKKTGQSATSIIEVLKKLEVQGYISLKLFTTDAALTFLVPREDDKTINPLGKEIELLNKKKKEQVASMLHYVENEELCRTLQLVQYFGEEASEVCGVCSVCAASEAIPNKKEAIFISEKIINLLEGSNLTSRELSEKLTFTESKIIAVLRKLVEVKRVGINSKNEYHLH